MEFGGSRGDEIGKRGEALFQLLVTELDGRPAPLFRADFLGSTFPGIDFMVTLVGFEGIAPFFFTQVKATRSGYRPDGRLRTRRITEEGLHAIAR